MDNPNNDTGRPVGTFDFSKRRFLRRLSIGAKLWINTAVLAVPLLLLGVFFVRSLSSTYFFTRTEQAGLRMAQPAVVLGQQLVLHGQAAAAGASGALDASARSATAVLEELKVADGLEGDPDSHGALATLQRQVEAALGARDASAASRSAHAAALDASAAYRTLVGNKWQLVLDPESASYNLLDAALFKLPDLDRALGDLAIQASFMASSARQGNASLVAAAQAVAIARDRAAAVAEEVATAQGAASSRPQLLALVNELGAGWATSFRATVDQAAADLESGQAGGDGLRRLAESAAARADELAGVQSKVHAAADKALALRGGSQMVGAAVAIGGALIMLLLGVSVMIMMANRISGAIKRLLGITIHIAAGDFETVIDRTGDDEISRLYDGVAAMQQRLREIRDEEQAAIERERQTNIVNERVRQALDSVDTCVMLADQDANILFVNRHLVSVLGDAAADIRQTLPHFDVHKLVGTNMDAFHKSPAHQRALVAGLSDAHVVTLRFVGRTFRLTATPVRGEGGERIGTVVEWFDRTQEASTEREVSEIVKAIVEGDLSRRITVAGRTGFYEVLGKGINEMVDNFTSIVRQVKGAAGEVHRGASEISTGNANLSARTEQQASSLEQTASSMEQMTSSVKQNAENASQANQLAAAARDQADKGGAVVARAMAAMGEINSSSKRIADIIGVIDEIAFQTNLLALNAAVEAARAGEQGRGFAVVASEVRNLAGRSATAAKEIKDLIRDSVNKVAEGSELVTQSGATLDQLVTAVKKVGDIVAEIASASHEQSTGIEEVNKAVMQLDELTQQNAALVEQATAASQSMAEQAQGLAETMERYHTGDHDLLEASATRRAAPAVAARQAPERPAPERPAPQRRPEPAARLAATGTDGGAEWSEF